MARIEPTMVDFQLRVIPTASTMVNASTHSTEEATNTAVARATISGLTSMRFLQKDERHFGVLRTYRPSPGKGALTEGFGPSQP